MKLRLQFQAFLWIGIVLLLYALYLTFNVPSVQNLIENINIIDEPDGYYSIIVPYTQEVNNILSSSENIVYNVSATSESPALSVSPTPVTLGTPFTVSGQYFAPGTEYNVHVDRRSGADLLLDERR